MNTSSSADRQQLVASIRVDDSRHHRLHAILASSNFAQGLGAFAVIGAMASLIHELQVPLHQAGLVVSLYAIAYAVASPLLVAWTGRWQRRTVLVAGLTLIAAGAAVGVMAQHFNTLLAGRALMAVGGGLVTPVAGAIGVATSTPQTRGRVLATVFAGLTLAQALGLPLGAWFAQVTGFRGLFATIAAVSVAVAALVWRNVPREVATARPGLRALGSVLKEPRLVAALMFIVFFIAGSFVLLTYLTPFLSSRLHIQGHALAGALLLYGMAAVAGNAMGGRLADRFGPPRMLVVLCAVQVTVLPLMTLFVLPAAVTLALLVAWAVFGWSVHATQQARLVALDPERAPVLLALHSSGIYIGASLGSAIAAAVLANSSDRWLGPAGAALMLAAVATMVVVKALGRPHPGR